MSIFLKCIDFLIPQNLKKDKETLNRVRLFIGILCVSFALAILIDFGNLYNNSDNLIEITKYITYSYSIVSLSILWLSKRISLAVSSFLLLLMLNLNLAISYTGGIVSSTTDWLCVIPFIALIMIGFRSAAIWMILVTVNIIFIYFVWDGIFLESLRPKDYFINSFMLPITLGVFLYLFWRYQKSLMGQLKKQQDVLKQKNKQLEKKTNELNIAQQSLTNSNQFLELQNNHLNSVQKALKESNKDLERYAHTVSHDLKEPLRSISNFTNLLERHYKRKNLIDDVSKEYFDFVSSGASNMNNLISEMLQISDLRNKKISDEAVDLKQIIQIVKQGLNHQIQASQAQIICNSLPKVNGSQVMLCQLFQNLISNAIKFRKENLIPQINIEANEKEKEWLISISDNGIGLKETDCVKIFQEFTKVNNPEEYEGQGIGLTTCKQIIEKHKGQIWLKSQLGVGTTFFFTLPKILRKNQARFTLEDKTQMEVVHKFG